MKIRNLDSTAFHFVDHLSAARMGVAAARQLPLHFGVADLPQGLDALVLAADLQGRVGERLLGEALADELARLAGCGILPQMDRTGVILAGDLYSAPGADVRGASGDVRPVWRAFVRGHRWAAGVAGNHDTFSDEDGFDHGRSFREAHLLDGRCRDLDGLLVGGVGGIIGDSRKPARRSEREFLRSLRKVLSARPDIVVLHQGPDAERGELRGHAAVRQALDRSGELLVVCGHVYWPRPLVEIRGGAQVLNVDGRVVILTRPDFRPRQPAAPDPA